MIKQNIFDSVTKRRTNRLRYQDEELPELIISKVKSTISDSNKIWLYTAKRSNEKEQLSNLIVEVE